MGNLNGKVVLVTGAANGFGREIAFRAAARGATAVASDIDASGAAEVASSIIATGGAALGLGLDVRDRQAFADATSQVITQYGRLDVLVNNAGVMPLAFLADHARAADAWDRCIDINLKGVLHGVCAVYDQMVRQNSGHIVNISSVYGNAGVAGAAVYSATKAAVATLSNALRVESQGRIKVTIVRPSGVVGTNLGATVLDPTAAAPLAAHRASEWQDNLARYLEGKLDTEQTDPADARYWVLSPGEVAEHVVNVIDQPLGVAVTDLTLRATGEDYVF
ncbi:MULTISPECIES: SDR family oxidoreductase [Pseudofrankia]|uniref:SDR family oxidoreductase n=1 Tax=Pseudofrankia TaxID=2994363 RepID=UPI000234D8A6|nr:MULTISPECIES: SDR family NAD(P)-dependent oxidoreductase [Pseudofrankia]OHV30913.1 short-chain dehydrogenase [Pseudofrankia sp. EUN1h]